MENARLIIDAPASGAWNMAVDQALLETADQTGRITLRFYRWSEPTLSLGYFQSHRDRALHPASLECPLVRRRTGGGAILHDQEITYSLSVPSTNRWSKKNGQLYDTMHQLMIQLLATQGIKSSLHANEPRSSHSGATREDGAFLCFLRRSPGDVVIDQFKVVGSAQRRIKNALLQHGSILCHRSRFAPELPGIRDLAPLKITDNEIVAKLCESAQHSLQIELMQGEMTETEKEAAKQSYSTQFQSDQWNQRR